MERTKLLQFRLHLVFLCYLLTLHLSPAAEEDVTAGAAFCFLEGRMNTGLSLLQVKRSGVEVKCDTSSGAECQVKESVSSPNTFLVSSSREDKCQCKVGPGGVTLTADQPCSVVPPDLEEIRRKTAIRTNVVLIKKVPAPAGAMKPPKSPAAPAGAMKPPESLAAPAGSMKPPGSPAAPAGAMKPPESLAAPAGSVKPPESPAAPAGAMKLPGIHAAPAGAMKPPGSPAAPAGAMKPPGSLAFEKVRAGPQFKAQRQTPGDLNQDCITPGDTCTPPNSECKGGKCVCEEDYKENNGICEPDPAQPGGLDTSTTAPDTSTVNKSSPKDDRSTTKKPQDDTQQQGPPQGQESPDTGGSDSENPPTEDPDRPKEEEEEDISWFLVAALFIMVMSNLVVIVFLLIYCCCPTGPCVRGVSFSGN